MDSTQTLKGCTMVTDSSTLARTAGPVATAAVLMVLSACNAASAQDVFESVRLADGVWASMVAAPHSPSQYANSLLVVGTEGALLVDTRATPSSARALVEWVRTITPLPVTHVVNTHRHSDHVYGNQVVLDAFPYAALIGHSAMVDWMDTEGAAQLESDRASAREGLDRWRRWLENGRTDDGQDLEARHVEELNAAIERTERRRVQLDQVRLRTPGTAVADSLIVHDGVRTIRILHPGPAHTSGDLVVHLPNESILWVGDLVEQGFPYFGHGTVTGWAKAMERLSAFSALRVISSHGRSTADAVAFATQARFWRLLVEGVREVRSAGASEDEVVENLRLDGFREFFAFGDPAAAEQYAAFVEEAVRACFAELGMDEP